MDIEWLVYKNMKVKSVEGVGRIKDKNGMEQAWGGLIRWRMKAVKGFHAGSNPM